MALQSSGTITLQQIATEFGGSGTLSLQNYYRGGSYVANTSQNASVPTSGTITLQDFYGASKGFGQIVIVAYAGYTSSTYYSEEYVGYSNAGWGTLSSCAVTFGSGCTQLASYGITSGGATTYTTQLSISNSSNPGQSAWNTMTLSGGGGPLTSGTATYSYASGVAAWEWKTISYYLSFTSGTTYTATFT